MTPAAPGDAWPEAGQASRVPTWVLAAVGAGLLHLGAAALAYAHLRSDADEPDLGAQAVAIGIELAAPHAEQTDLPPGPEADDASASTAQVERQRKVEPNALPKETPTDAPDPDRAVAPEATEKPKDDAQAKAQSSSASAESVASEAAAPPSSPTTVEAPRSTAPAIGTGDSARRVEATWQRKLVAYLDHHKRYPADAAARDAQILVAFRIDRAGHVLSSAVATSSGDRAFDEAALAMVRRSDPVPAPPPLVADEHLSFTVPVNFHKRNGRG